MIANTTTYSDVWQSCLAQIKEQTSAEEFASVLSGYGITASSTTGISEALRLGKEKARELAELFSGNPGKCQSSLSDDEEKMYIEAARKIARAIASKNKFATSAALTENTGRGEFAAIQNRLSEILRDALVIRCGGNAESCGKTEAADIAKAYNEQDIIRMLEAIMDVGENTLLNLNMQLTTAYLTARLF